MEYTVELKPDSLKTIESTAAQIADIVHKTFATDTEKAILFYWNGGSSSTYYVLYDNKDGWDKKYPERDSIRNETDTIKELVTHNKAYIFSVYIDKNGKHEYKFYAGINPEISSDAIWVVAHQEYGAMPSDDYTKKNFEKALKQENLKKTLAYACYQNDIELVKQLLPKAKPSAIEKKIKLIGTSLHSAVKNNNIGMAELLVKAGADIEAANFMGYTPLLQAIDNGNEEMARWFIGQGANVNKQGAQNNNALSLAISTSKISESFLDLLIHKGSDVNSLISDKRNLLSIAASTNAGRVKFLLNKGINRDYIPSAISMAVSVGKPETIEVLLNAGGKLDNITDGNSDILYHLCQQGKIDTIKYLLDKKLSFTGKPPKAIKLYYKGEVRFKDSPYEWAKYCEQYEVAKLIESTF